jgi:ribonucleoside-diphosphate reductase alpha chain
VKQIDKKITGYKVKNTLEPVITPTISLIDREETLTGKTYKISPTDHAYYITINDIEVNGVKRPYEVFINTKDVTHFQWVQLFTRLASAIFRHGGDYEFVVEEMKAIEDAATGRFVKGKGHVPSLVAEIGLIVEEHIANLKLENSK